MAHKIGIYYNEAGIRSIMKGHEIAQMEQDIMMKKLSQIKAEFLTTFGFDGSFEIERVDTKSRRSRTTFRIKAANGRTASTLKKQPGWLAKFI